MGFFFCTLHRHRAPLSLPETQLVFRGGATDKKSVPPGIDPRSLSNEGSMDRIAMIDDDLFITGSDNGALCLWSVQKKKPRVHRAPGPWTRPSHVAIRGIG